MAPFNQFQTGPSVDRQQGRHSAMRPQLYDPSWLSPVDALYDPRSPPQHSMSAAMVPPHFVANGARNDDRRFTPAREEAPSAQSLCPGEPEPHSVGAGTIINSILTNLRRLHEAKEAEKCRQASIPATLAGARAPEEEAVGIATPPGSDGFVDESKEDRKMEVLAEAASLSIPTPPGPIQASPRTDHYPPQEAVILTRNSIDTPAANLEDAGDLAGIPSALEDTNAIGAATAFSIASTLGDLPRVGGGAEHAIAAEIGVHQHTRDTTAVALSRELEAPRLPESQPGIRLATAQAPLNCNGTGITHDVARTMEALHVESLKTEASALRESARHRTDDRETMHSIAERSDRRQVSAHESSIMSAVEGKQSGLGGGEISTNVARATEEHRVNASTLSIVVPRESTTSQTRGNELLIGTTEYFHPNHGKTVVRTPPVSPDFSPDFSPLSIPEHDSNQAQLPGKPNPPYLPLPKDSVLERPAPENNSGPNIARLPQEGPPEDVGPSTQPTKPRRGGAELEEQKTAEPSKAVPGRPSLSGTRTCPCAISVPAVFLMILEGTHGLPPQMATVYAQSHKHNLCAAHLRKLTGLEPALAGIELQTRETAEARDETKSRTRKSTSRASTAKKPKQTSTPRRRLPAPRSPAEAVPAPTPVSPSNPASDISSSIQGTQGPPSTTLLKSNLHGKESRVATPSRTEIPGHAYQTVAGVSPHASVPAVSAAFEIPIQAKRPIPVDPESLLSDQTYKRPCQGLGYSAPRVNGTATYADPARPVHNLARDADYRLAMMSELQQRIQRDDGLGFTHGSATAPRILELLQRSKQPNIDPHAGPVDVLFLSGDEALSTVEADSTSLPIITQSQQPFKWDPKSRPIHQLFRRMEDLDRSVAVQIPSRDNQFESFESRQLTTVQARFLARHPTDDPWNILDLRSPIPAAILPAFLTGENCQLLPRLRDAVLQGRRAERGSGTRDQWNEWRDVLEWVLLSEGGHNTAPHTDSHGLATWISVQEGLFGFGWMSNPTEGERDAWNSKPLEFVDAQWRYLVLQPGQTVFFNSGTVHYVFRLKTEQTLALGGHVLQWSGIERWINVVSAQLHNPDMTNEDMEWSAPKYVRVVADLVERRVKNGRAEEMGGEEGVGRLLALLKAFDEKHVRRPRPKKGKVKKKRTR